VLLFLLTAAVFLLTAPVFLGYCGFTGEDSFVYTITDGKGGSSNATVSITVEPGKKG